MKNKPILTVENLVTEFDTHEGKIKPVDGVSFEIYEGETLGIVGESGCGKSVTSLSIMRLLPEPIGRIKSGKINLENVDLTKLTDKKMQKYRGNELAMIFQEPMTSLNPVFTIGQQLSEPLKQHTNLAGSKIKKRIINTLHSVGIPRAETIINEYPHQLSGGMRQRVMIALAMLCDPKLLIADEPTTALDVTIQAQVLEIIKDISRKSQMALILITHDLGVIAEMCDKVIVMYAGQIVENTDVRTLFNNPKHPYTRGLLNSLPKSNERKGYLQTIKGNVPAPTELTKGCRFAPRCPVAFDKCWTQNPPLIPLKNQLTRCWLYENKEVNNNDE